MSQFEHLKNQFKNETGLDAKTNIQTYFEYLKNFNLIQITTVLAEINNRLAQIKSIQERRK